MPSEMAVLRCAELTKAGDKAGLRSGRRCLKTSKHWQPRTRSFRHDQLIFRNLEIIRPLFLDIVAVYRPRRELQKAAPRNFDAFFDLFILRSKKRQSKFLRCARALF